MGIFSSSYRAVYDGNIIDVEMISGLEGTQITLIINNEKVDRAMIYLGGKVGLRGKLMSNGKSKNIMVTIKIGFWSTKCILEIDGMVHPISEL